MPSLISASERVHLLRVADVRSADLRFASPRFAALKFVHARLALERLTLAMLISVKFPRWRSGEISAFFFRHRFQLRTPCLNKAICSVARSGLSLVRSSSNAFLLASHRSSTSPYSSEASVLLRV